MLIAEQMTFEKILSRIHYNRVYNYTEQLAVIDQLDHFLTQHPNVIIAELDCYEIALLKLNSPCCISHKLDQVGGNRLHQFFIPCRLCQLSHALPQTRRGQPKAAVCCSSPYGCGKFVEIIHAHAQCGLTSVSFRTPIHDLSRTSIEMGMIVSHTIYTLYTSGDQSKSVHHKSLVW